jgi:hypothetical protein
MPTNEFASLPLAQDYIDTVRVKVGAFGNQELIAALKRLSGAYNEYPELELYCPRRELLNGFCTAAKELPDCAAIVLLMYCVALDPSCSFFRILLFEKIAVSEDWRSLSPVLGSLDRWGFCWSSVEPIIRVMQQLGRVDAIVCVLSEIFDCIVLDKPENASSLGNALVYLLSDKHSGGIDGSAVAKAVRSARRRLRQLPCDRTAERSGERRSREVLLAIAERLKITSLSQSSHPHPELAWPSGKLSFAEFVHQWPCEIRLSPELDEAAFVDEAYRAILLRGPDVDEMTQHLGLLRNGALSRLRIIEGLLACEELHSLERRVRVIWGEQVITQPGKSADKEIPAVTWPCQSPG